MLYGYPDRCAEPDASLPGQALEEVLHLRRQLILPDRIRGLEIRHGLRKSAELRLPSFHPHVQREPVGHPRVCAQVTCGVTQEFQLRFVVRGIGGMCGGVLDMPAPMVPGRPAQGQADTFDDPYLGQ